MIKKQHQSVKAKTRVSGDKGIEYISYLVEITLIQHTIPLLNTLKIDARTKYFGNSTQTPKYISLLKQIEKNYQSLKVFIKANYTMIYCIMSRVWEL